jgi:6-pyruvoyl-tetrahydropterin synthase
LEVLSDNDKKILSNIQQSDTATSAKKKNAEELLDRNDINDTLKTISTKIEANNKLTDDDIEKLKMILNQSKNNTVIQKAQSLLDAHYLNEIEEAAKNNNVTIDMINTLHQYAKRTVSDIKLATKAKEVYNNYIEVFVTQFGFKNYNTYEYEPSNQASTISKNFLKLCTQLIVNNDKTQFIDMLKNTYTITDNKKPFVFPRQQIKIHEMQGQQIQIPPRINIQLNNIEIPQQFVFDGKKISPLTKENNKAGNLIITARPSIIEKISNND